MSLHVFRNRRRIALAALLAGGLTALGAAQAGTGVTASAAGTQTITFAESGLGTEGQQTAAAIKAFEKANPSIKVTIDVLSPNSTTYLSNSSSTSSPARALPTCSSRT